MNNKIGWLKITTCAVFLTLFGAAFFLSSAAKTSAVKPESGDAENPQNCAACHQSDVDSWHRTNHQKTVKKATNEAIKGDFRNNNLFESADFKASMSSDGENFSIKIGDDLYKVAAVVGVKYIEQYVGEKDGEFYSLPIAYNLQEKRWVHLDDTDFARKDAEFSRHLQNWKTDCAACHQPNSAGSAGNFQDFGISCSVCHGNASEHIESKTSIRATLGLQTENKIINPQNLSSDASMLICASCHSRDLEETAQLTKFRAEENPVEIISAHQPTDSNAERFWANGENKFSGNEFQAIVRSVCYAQSKSGGHGISGEKINCASCHLQHETSGEFRVSAKSYNQNCINCHAQFSDDAAIVEHTKHSLNSEASNCASCHQPEMIYGRMRFARTHEISVPNPSLTVEKQIPNACNLCHVDQSVNWAIAASKIFWSERFRDSEISSSEQFNKPEMIRLLSSNNAFLRALAADSVKKHSASNQSAPFLPEVFQIERVPLVKYFLAAALKSK